MRQADVVKTLLACCTYGGLESFSLPFQARGPFTAYSPKVNKSSYCCVWLSKPSSALKKTSLGFFAWYVQQLAYLVFYSNYPLSVARAMKKL